MAVVGEAFLSASLQVALDKLASPVLREFGLRLSVNKDLKRLVRILSKIQAVLDDAEQRQISDKAVELWLSDLKQVAFDVEDLLDEVATEAENPQVRNLLSLPRDFLFKFELAPKIQDIMERLQEISNERDELNLKEGVGRRWSEINERPQTSSLVDESCVFGRTDDARKIVELLLVQDDCSGAANVSVIPIVGMGGFGKTTLAQLAYNKENVMNHFELRMWICVSDDSDVIRITRSIIEAATKRASDLKDLDPLQSQLQDILKGKRFLLVLDDVWNEKKSDWEVASLPFRVGAKGSKILVTTRSKKVASILGTIDIPYELNGLSDVDCWELFKRKAFVDGNSDVHPHLVEIGKKIIKKCKGMPLAAKTLGGLLYSKFSEEDWHMILNSDVWDLEENNNEILPALLLSYNHLSPHLRQCFAYCSIFPKDYGFRKVKLIQFWVAEGFVQTKKNKSLEDVGCEYFDDLLLRSFFQHSTIDKSKFVMHDLIHDLAQFVSRETCFTMTAGKPCNISEKTGHLSLICNTFESIPLEAFHRAKRLRTLLSYTVGDISSLPVVDLILELRLLRVLDLSNSCITELPESIGDHLKHLRYLSISKTKIRRLPESTCCLHNLEILNLGNCKHLVELPNFIGNLKHLRSLML